MALAELDQVGRARSEALLDRIRLTRIRLNIRVLARALRSADSMWEAQGRMVVHAYNSGASAEEIADAAGIPLSAVKARLAQSGRLNTV